MSVDQTFLGKGILDSNDFSTNFYFELIERPVAPRTRKVWRNFAKQIR